MAEQVIKRICLLVSGPIPNEADEQKPKPLYVNPTPVPGKTGDAAFPVQVNQTFDIGAWQWADLIQDGHDFYVEYPTAQRTVSFAPKGIETRPKGVRQSWERLRAVQEPSQNGNQQMLYRFHNECLLYVIKYIEV